MQWVANHLFAPNEDGCQTVMHAATDPWDQVSEADTDQQAPLRVRLPACLSASTAISLTA